MNEVGANIRKQLPSLVIGILITILAALFNYTIYDRRLPAMAAGNRIFTEETRKSRAPKTAMAAATRILAGLVNISDEVATDLMSAARGPGDSPSTHDQIAVIAIDEASMLRRGAWPWSRRDLGQLVEKVADARVVGLDMVFNEPDKTSLANYVDTFERLFDIDLNDPAIPNEIMDNDLFLARKISQTRTVLGAVLYDGGEPEKKPNRPIANYSLQVRAPENRSVPMQDALLKKSEYMLADLPTVRQYIPPPYGEGFLNLFPPPSGIVRSVPLLAHVSDKAFTTASGQARRIVPNLALEVMRIALGGDGYVVNLRGDFVNIPEFADDTSTGDRYAVKSVSIVRTVPEGTEELMRIPLNELGEVEVGFRHNRGDYRIYPAWEVLEGMHDGAFDNKIVIIGGTVPGIGYVVATGLPDPEVSVAEAHATMLSTMIKGDFIDSGYQDDYFWQQICILASGLAITVAIIFGNIGFAMIVSGVVLVVIILANYYAFFRNGMSVGITLPLLSTLAVLVTLAIANYLVVGRERRFIRRAFSLNVSPSILGYLETHPDRLSSLQGENRYMSVLFTDIRGFTSISERMTAPDLALFLNEYFTPMSDIVMRHMGTVDKFIGDGLMAFWNAPADNPMHARDAARSALDMLQKLQELQPGWTNRGLPRVLIGCGINTGPMFAGYMGSEQRKNYTVMGDSVNIASRLENLNKFYSSSILITENTREKLGDDFVYRVVDKVRVSGKMTAVVIYELLGQGQASEEEREELASFARVFELYQEREFATAESLLKELVFIRPRPLYKMYLDRLAIYKALPPPPDWDGTFSMTQK